MKRNLLFLTLTAIGLLSCNGGFNKGNGGMLYKIHTDNSGAKIVVGDFVSYNLIAKTEADSVIVNTYEKGHASYLVVPRPGHTGDMNEALTLLTEGDSATIKINIDSIYGIGNQRPPYPGKYIIYTIKMEKVIPKGDNNEAQFNAKIVSYSDQQVDKEKKAEQGKLKKYIADNKLSGVTTPSGLFYAITKPGIGDKPQVGDTVVLNYTVRQLNNEIKGTSIKAVAIANKKYRPFARYAPFSFALGSKDVVRAWDEGFRYLNKGAKAIFVSPADMAYIIKYNDHSGQWAVPLVFDVEVLDIKHPKPAATAPATK